ncbi:unnamed protein product [Cylicocyclus nassatus]|uniref:N-acetyltransferase domain-containing protein n=1 Tax=Cylicocyclus nassatus TaxID=53992 RepID=A0AA36GXB7_CYLNA|nr:unnamed protein product [Cylicocyclus nassatus]
MIDRFRYVPATKDHADKILDFLINQFGKYEPINASTKATKDDLIDLFRDTAHHGYTNDKYSTLVYDGNRLIAMCLCSLCSTETMDAPFPAQIDVKNHDFAEDIVKGPYKQHKANQIIIFVRFLEDTLSQMLSKHKFMKMDILCVHKDYMGQGLGKELNRWAMQNAQAEGCEYIATAATAAASQAIFAKSGWKILYEVPYASYRENGNPVFQNLHDGCQSAKVVAAKLY